MAVSAICILDSTGAAICARDYRGECSLAAADKFFTVLSDLEETSGATPVLQHEGVTYVWLRHADVFLVALCQSNANAASTISFLEKLLEVFKFYFKLVIEESIRDNFVTVYELLDEVMDFGYPQFTEGAILREYIKTEAHKLEDFVGGMLGSSVHSRGNKELPPQVTGVGTNWRKQGVYYQRNEVCILLCISKTGKVVHMRSMTCCIVQVIDTFHRTEAATDCFHIGLILDLGDPRSLDLSPLR
jgi:AP-1 complex subunit mu